MKVNINQGKHFLKLSFSRKCFVLINAVILSLLTFSCVLPLWYTLCVSLSGKTAIAAGSVGLWPVDITLTSYKAIMKDSGFIRSFGVSFIRVVAGTAFSLAVMLMMAYPLSKAKREFKYRNIFMWILIFCFLFNGGLVPWYITMKNYGLINTMAGLVLAGGVPVYNVILVMNFFRNIPKSLEEAAIVDGAGPWTILLKVIIPISKPVIATVTLFTIVNYWNEFFQGLVLSTTEKMYPLQTYIQQMVVTLNMTNMTLEQYQQMSQLSNQGLNAAKLFIALIPVLVVYPFLQKYFISGITLGAVKE